MAFHNETFFWWHVVDGVAVYLEDTPEVSRAIDAGELRNIYSTIEGAITYGGVCATAFTRKTEQTYDAMAYLQRGEWIPRGEITTTEITASREA